MTEVNAESEREFTVVMRGPSAIVFRQDEYLPVEKFPSEIGPVNIVYKSRWIKKSETVTTPGHLWIEIRGEGKSLKGSLVPFANAGLALLPGLSLSANAAIGEPEIELGFESTPKVSKREYFQSYVPLESGVVHCARHIDVGATVALLRAIKRHSDAERLWRAANQHQLALDSWKLGRETLSLAHLWMALEALTKARIRAECAARGISSEQELASSLGVKKEDLDSTVRRELILCGDKQCYKSAKEASDGLEHGFLGYAKIREFAKDVRHRMAKYIRNAILRLSGLGEEPLRLLTEPPFDKPMGHWPLVKYVRGHLVGGNPQLAAKGNAYPFLLWKPVISKCEVGGDGKMKIEFSENFTAKLGEGISFQPSSYETWEPE